ncbi:MAG: purine-nucleoside phosphorylase [Melioribacteraceae bacterium]|nr:purine-nucleoside phosphorylase [Melioribacteraceae bacterium]
MINIREKYKQLIQFVKDAAPFNPEIGLILGSGLGEFANSFVIIKSIATSEIPGYPPSTVQGHQGQIHFVDHRGKKLLLFQGRIHLYEGYHISDSVIPVELAASLGVKKLILTNAAGGINPLLNPGDLMIIQDFNTLSIKNDLVKLFGVGSPDMHDAVLNFPSKGIAEVFNSAFLDEDVETKRGIYYFTKGPSYETPAEIRMMKISGADAVGMSTAHEAIYGLVRGLDVGAISLITNYAAGISDQKLSHQEVIETADLAKVKFERLMKRIIGLL